MVKNKAFTLAEVLITLAIIGVVAALTIPSVIVKQQKTQYYTQFMKVFNTLSAAVSMASATNGFPDSWGINGADNYDIIMNNLAPYLKITKTCGLETADYENCGITHDFDVYIPEDDGNETYQNFIINDGSGRYANAEPGTLVFVLNDGSLITVNTSIGDGSYPGYLTFTIDTNGPGKGPNYYGKDIFDGLVYAKIDHQKYQMSALGLINKCTDDKGDTFCIQSQEDLNNDIEGCGKKFGTTIYCSARLLHDRKMNYDF